MILWSNRIQKLPQWFTESKIERSGCFDDGNLRTKPKTFPDVSFYTIFFSFGQPFSCLYASPSNFTFCLPYFMLSVTCLYLFCLGLVSLVQGGLQYRKENCCQAQIKFWKVILVRERSQDTPGSFWSSKGKIRWQKQHIFHGSVFWHWKNVNCSSYFLYN